MGFKSIALVASTLVLSTSVNAAIIGTTGTLYLTQYNGTEGAIVQGDSIINTFTTSTVTETAIAVDDTLRIMNGFANSGTGSEYDLNGNIISPGIYSNTTYDSLYDGTTDGQYNYAIDHNGNGFQTVFRFDSDWANGVSLFTTTNRGSGISYDANTNTLWTTEGTGSPSGWIRQYSMTGNLLTSFDLLSASAYGLAYDSLDNTLWATGFGSNVLYQYSTSGDLLQSYNWNDQLFDNAFGIEFAASAVPVPAAVWLFGSGLLGLIGLARKG